MSTATADAITGTPALATEISPPSGGAPRRLRRSARCPCPLERVSVVEVAFDRGLVDLEVARLETVVEPHGHRPVLAVHVGDALPEWIVGCLRAPALHDLENLVRRTARRGVDPTHERRDVERLEASDHGPLGLVAILCHPRPAIL